MPIAIIRIEHDYCAPPANPFVDMEQTPDTRKLTDRRGVLLRSTDRNEWQWIMSNDAPGFMDDDALELSMIVKSPDFLQQIESKEYELGGFYKFTVKDGVTEVNADYVWKQETEGQKLRNEFCRLTLKPAQTLQAACCPIFTLRFSSRPYYWEYLCIFRDENDLRGKDLSMKCSDNSVSFFPPEKCGTTAFGANVWRIVSIARIPLKEHYDFSLQLYLGTRVENRFISPPQMGKFRSDSPDILREICYIREQ